MKLQSQVWRTIHYFYHLVEYNTLFLEAYNYGVQLLWFRNVIQYQESVSFCMMGGLQGQFF